MKGFLKLLLIIPSILIVCFLLSCNDLYGVNKKDVDKIHNAIESLETFENELSYLTSFGSINATVVEENYLIELQTFEENQGIYEYKWKEKKIYKDNEIIEEEVENLSMDDFAEKIVLLHDSTSYCISINEFVPFIKEVFLESKEFKHSVIHDSKVYYTCVVSGNSILNKYGIDSLLKRMNKETNVQDNDILELALLFSTDFSTIYPEFSLSVNKKSIVSFE